MSLSLGFSSWLVSFLREDSSNLLPEGEGLTASILGITEKRVLGNSSFTLQEAVTQSPCFWSNIHVHVPSPDITGFPLSREEKSIAREGMRQSPTDTEQETVFREDDQIRFLTYGPSLF